MTTEQEYHAAKAQIETEKDIAQQGAVNTMAFLKAMFERDLRNLDIIAGELDVRYKDWLGYEEMRNDPLFDDGDAACQEDEAAAIHRIATGLGVTG